MNIASVLIAAVCCVAVAGCVLKGPELRVGPPIEVKVDGGNGGNGGGGTNRSSDLEDVLSRGSDRDRAGSDRSSSRVERDESGIAAALERGERTAE
jgi:hypothetical protein